MTLSHPPSPQSILCHLPPLHQGRACYTTQHLSLERQRSVTDLFTLETWNHHQQQITCAAIYNNLLSPRKAPREASMKSGRSWKVTLVLRTDQTEIWATPSTGNGIHFLCQVTHHEDHDMSDSSGIWNCFIFLSNWKMAVMQKVWKGISGHERGTLTPPIFTTHGIVHYAIVVVCPWWNTIDSTQAILYRHNLSGFSGDCLICKM